MPLRARFFACLRGMCSRALCVRVLASRVRTCVERFSRYLVHRSGAALALPGSGSVPWCVLVVAGRLSLVRPGGFLSWVPLLGSSPGFLSWVPLLVGVRRCLASFRLGVHGPPCLFCGEGTRGWLASFAGLPGSSVFDGWGPRSPRLRALSLALPPSLLSC